MDVPDSTADENLDRSPEREETHQWMMDVDLAPSVEGNGPVPTPAVRVIPPPSSGLVESTTPGDEGTTATSESVGALDSDGVAKPKQNLSLKLGGASLASSPTLSDPPLPSFPLKILSPDSAAEAKPINTPAQPNSGSELSPSSRFTTPSALTPQSAVNGGAGLRWKPRQGSVTSDVSMQSIATLGSLSSRGKHSRDKEGWGNMPVGLMHIILSYAMDDIKVPFVIDQRFFTQANDLALVLLKRVWLCKMRQVSTGWRNVVDSHPFWPEYTLEMDQSRRHPSTIDDLEASSLTPSTPSFPTLFHRARHTTLHVCVACRLNHPDRVGLYPAVRKRLTHTTSFGPTPTCERHGGNYCSSCMREQEMTPQSRTRGGVTVNYSVPSGEWINLLFTDPFDTDQSGASRGGSILCAYCRKFNVEQLANIILRQCARGTVIRGAGHWHKWEFDASKRYIVDSDGTLWNTARSTVDEYWLNAQTRWEELFRTAWELQAAEEQLRLFYLVRGYRESPRDRKTRLLRLAELEGVDADVDCETRERLLADVIEMNQKYQDWDNAVDRRYTERDLREYRPPIHLSQRWWLRLYFASINDWIKDRIRYGFWMAPSDEMQNYLDNKAGWDPEDETDFRRIALGAEHPFAELLDSDLDPPGAYCETTGIMYVSSNRDIHDPNHPRARGSFFPPRQLLDNLDIQYAERLKEVLRPALVQCAKLAWYRAQDEQAAEEICGKWSVEALLAMLRRPGTWAKDGLMIEECQRQLDIQQQEIISLRALQRMQRPITNNTGSASEDEDFDMDTGDELDDTAKPDYMRIDVEDDDMLSDEEDLVPIELEQASIRPISPADSTGRQTSPWIELVVEEDEAIENPANVQEVIASPAATIGSDSSHVVDSVEPTAIAPAQDRPASRHTPMNSIDDVLKIQAELLAEAKKKSEANGHSAMSTSAGSLGKRKQAPETDGHDLMSPEKKSPARGLSGDLSMRRNNETSKANADEDIGSDGTTSPAGTGLKPSPPLFTSRLSPDDPSRSPKSSESTSATSPTSDPSSDVTSGPVLLTPPDDSALDPALVNRSDLPEHLRDVSAEDMRAIMEASGRALGTTSTPASKGSSSTLTSITLSDTGPDATAQLDWDGPRKEERGSKRFPPRLVPHSPARNIPYIPPLPAYALGPKTIHIIRQLWREVRAELRMCKCSVCKRRIEMDAYEDDDDDEVVENLKVVDPRWSRDEGKKMRLG